VSDIDLSAPEVQEAITAAVEKATAPLVAKRDELLGEVKKLRKGREIDPAEVEKLETEIDALKGQLSEATKAARKAAQDAEKATKALADAEGYTANLLRDGALTEALVKAGVTNPVHQKAAKALLREQVAVVAEGDQKIAKVGDKAVGDFITEWAGSDEGKHFVTAQEANGGGSQGGYRGGKGPAPKRSEMNHVQKAEFIKEHGPEAYSKLPD
jgi:hypothetical protein